MKQHVPVLALLVALSIAPSVFAGGRKDHPYRHSDLDMPASLAIGTVRTPESCNSGLTGNVDKFISETERETGKRVVVIEYAGNTICKGTNSRTTIFAMLKPHATESEIAEAIVFGVLATRGYAAASSTHGDQTERDFAFNLGSFVKSPKADSQTEQAGFRTDKREIYRSYLKAMDGDATRSKAEPSAADMESPKLVVAANALGLALALRESKEFRPEIERLATKRFPLTYSLAKQLAASFPPKPSLSAEDSYTVLVNVLKFLDNGTTVFQGSKPSECVKVVNPALSPLLDDAQESKILNDTRQGIRRLR